VTVVLPATRHLQSAACMGSRAERTVSCCHQVRVLLRRPVHTLLAQATGTGGTGRSTTGRSTLRRRAVSTTMAVSSCGRRHGSGCPHGRCVGAVPSLASSARDMQYRSSLAAGADAAAAACARNASPLISLLISRCNPACRRPVQHRNAVRHVQHTGRCCTALTGCPAADVWAQHSTHATRSWK